MRPGRHRTGNNDSRRYIDWLERACEDREAARLLMDCEATLDAAAFHCQQCIEKALKGYLLYKTGVPADGHNLSWLCKQAIKSDGRFREWLDESAALNRYYIETRYPADIPVELSDVRVHRVFDMADKMYRFIRAEVGDEACNEGETLLKY